jgi:hypothetical protein
MDTVMAIAMMGMVMAMVMAITHMVTVMATDVMVMGLMVTAMAVAALNKFESMVESYPPDLTMSVNKFS